MDVGSPVAPPTSSGSGSNAGVVISSQPGTKVGLPTSGSAGALAMSPSGGDKPGLGGSGSGTGIGRGDGPGSGMSGEGSGAGKSGASRGSDPNARGGISPSAGPGGAGNATSGTPPVPGVSVSGGSSQITLPSFGSDAGANDPTTPAHTGLKQRQSSFDVDVVATASSGGPFEPYKDLLRGETHTIYPETSSSLGPAVMQYADESGTGRGAVLHPPEPIRTTLPNGLPHARMMVICTLDSSGNLTNLRVLEAGSGNMTAKVLAALSAWKFEPARRGDQPVAVTAILGFNINTDDRF
jgi:TonB family protein